MAHSCIERARQRSKADADDRQRLQTRAAQRQSGSCLGNNVPKCQAGCHGAVVPKCPNGPTWPDVARTAETAHKCSTATQDAVDTSIEAWRRRIERARRRSTTNTWPECPNARSNASMAVMPGVMPGVMPQWPAIIMPGVMPQWPVMPGVMPQWPVMPGVMPQWLVMPG